MTQPVFLRGWSSSTPSNFNFRVIFSIVLFVISSLDELKIQVDEKRITVRCHDGRNVLCLKSNLVDVLVIEHIELDNKRIEVATKILDWIEEYGKYNGFKVLTAESVLPDEIEIVNFYEKNNFKNGNIADYYNYSKNLRY